MSSRNSIKSNPTAGTKICAVDLFCGVGGLTHGLIQGGIDVSAGIDFDDSCRFPYEENNDATFIHKDITKVSASDISAYFQDGSFSLLAGCAPCQPFSTYSQSNKPKKGDARWDLLLNFGALVKELKPDFVTMENVPKVQEYPVFAKFLKQLDGYNIWYDTVFCPEYGIPQTRKRLVLLASKHGPIRLIPPTHKKPFPSVRKAIAHLPKISAGEKNSKDPLHASSGLSSINLKRIKASKPGGTWRDWPKALLAECHKRESGKTYPGVYGRMSWDEPSPTITTQCFGFGNGRFGHPDQNRAISLREAAILQSFPRSYKFASKEGVVQFSEMGRLIGNAVPVRLGEVIAQSILSHLPSSGAST